MSPEVGPGLTWPPFSFRRHVMVGYIDPLAFHMERFGQNANDRRAAQNRLTQMGRGQNRSALRRTEMTAKATKRGAISNEHVQSMRAGVDNDAAAVRARNSVTEVGVQKAAINHAKATSTRTSMSERLDTWPATSQGKSGRCWLFASLNMLRPGVMEKMNVKEFEFSQNYAMFWEKLERSNYFLESMIELADQPLNSRLVRFLLNDVMNDGGQWDMLAAVYQKYGVVPKEAMPETFDSSNTEEMNQRLRTLLRTGALRLREMIAAGDSAEAVQAKKEELLNDVYRILTISLGVPPQTFDWQWQDADGIFHRDGEITPEAFYDKYVGTDLGDYVCLVNDPRREHPQGSTLTVEYLGDVVGGQQILYLNVDIDTMKKLATESIQKGDPVWFGCDVGQMMSRERGLMVNDLYDYSDLLGVDLSTTKEERVNSGQSMMTHAMLLVGVDLVDGKPRRWRVENSWGTDIGDKGFFTMDDDWFTEYVFEVVVKKSDLPDELRAALDTDPLVLPAWDPMGALARPGSKGSAPAGVSCSRYPCSC